MTLVRKSIYKLYSLIIPPIMYGYVSLQEILNKSIRKHDKIKQEIKITMLNNSLPTFKSQLFEVIFDWILCKKPTFTSIIFSYLKSNDPINTKSM